MENLITIPLNISAEAADREYSLAVLAKHNGNRTRTAKILRISLRGLRNKINAWKSMGFYVTPPTIKRYDGT